MGITMQTKWPIPTVSPESGNQSDPAVQNTDTLAFSESTCMSCVGIIDIVNSTKITARLNRHQMNKFYSLFINWTNAVVRGYGGKVVKNMGDSLLFYFQLSDDHTHDKVVSDALNCGIAMSMLHPNINSKFSSELLPELNYRISLDYGEISFAKAEETTAPDIFGVTVNVCAKINNIADPNTVVIGGDMHQVSRNLPGYDFQESRRVISIASRPYPVYSVTESRRVIQYLRSIRHRDPNFNSTASHDGTDRVDEA